MFCLIFLLGHIVLLTELTARLCSIILLLANNIDINYTEPSQNRCVHYARSFRGSKKNSQLRSSETGRENYYKSCYLRTFIM